MAGFDSVTSTDNDADLDDELLATAKGIDMEPRTGWLAEGVDEDVEDMLMRSVIESLPT